MLNRKIVYLPHPVSWEVKQKHLNAGERILDVRFAPKDYKVEAKEPDFVPPIAQTIAQDENVVIEVEATPKRRGRPRISK